MRTGIIVLGQHSDSPGEQAVAERCAEYLKSNGRKDVHIAYHYGTPSSDDVMESMNRNGTDTFVILPLAISEGTMTVWKMPQKMGLPDNCGSWRMMDGKDVATRFATALGRNNALAEELIAREGEVQSDTLLLLVAHGSESKDCEDTTKFYAEKLRERGWMTAYAFCRHGKTIEDVIGSSKKDIKNIRVIPLFIAFDGKGAQRMKYKLNSCGFNVEYKPPVSHLDSFYRILDSKVPKGW